MPKSIFDKPSRHRRLFERQWQADHQAKMAAKLERNRKQDALDREAAAKCGVSYGKYRWAVFIDGEGWTGHKRYEDALARVSKVLLRGKRPARVGQRWVYKVVELTPTSE